MQFLSENNKTRPKYIPARGKALKLPIYFPSISSVKTGLSPFDYFRILKALKQSHFLVSAFDIDKAILKDKFVQELKQNKECDGPIILMDSGNYESYWIRDKGWNIDKFNSILKEEVSDLAFCFDNQFPDKDLSKNVAWIAQSLKTSQEVTQKTSIIPIVHCGKEDLTSIVPELYQKTNFPIVSIPERILGNGLMERVITITNLRKELNKRSIFPCIHLLGTGNPLSLLLLSLAGADSFDGLEWCQTVVNPNTTLLYHFQHRELINDGCTFCKSTDIDYNLATLGHNLIFYNRWMESIQKAIETGTEKEVLSEYFDKEIMTFLKELWA